MVQNKSLSLLSISRKGQNLVYGEDTVAAAARTSRARLVIVASDAGAHTVRRARSCIAGTAQPMIIVPFTKDELGDALGVSSCAVVAITDVRLAQAFVKTLDKPHPELLQDLDIRVQRVEKRREEEKAHKRNVRRGKK